MCLRAVRLAAYAFVRPEIVEDSSKTVKILCHSVESRPAGQWSSFGLILDNFELAVIDLIPTWLTVENSNLY